jgi:DNA-binding LacI/PurR family transcriptional regulator
MADIAVRAGVSRMAVSAVLMGTGNGRIGVSAQTADRIRQIAEELGYRPNAAAQQLAGKRSGVIAVVAHDWKNFLAQRVLTWLHEAAEKDGFRILATRALGTLDPIVQLLRDARSGWVDGVVYLAHENEAQWPAVAALLQQVSNVVTVVGDLRVPGVTGVVSDVVSGARASIEHLQSRGRRHPVLITEELETPAIRARIGAYCQAAEECGIEFRVNDVHQETQDWLISDPAFYPRFDELARAIVSEWRADSVLCDTDFTAVGLLRAFRRLGLSVPDDMSVIGWGDLQFAALYDPRITTVTHQLSELLSRVVSKLQQQIGSGADAGEIELVDTTLVVRETS